MNAILYAAGRATRLGSHACGRPKVLLEFGGLSLLERHVMWLGRLGVPKLFVVTGYRRECLEAELPRLEARYGVAIEEMFNADFAEGSALSMHASLPALESAGDGVLLMDADVLYDGRLLWRLIESSHRTALLVDCAYSTADDDPVLVPMRDGKPFDFIKRWRGTADSVGESVGFFKISAADLPRLIAETRARIRGPGRAESYDDILRVLVREGRFGAVDATGMPWTEIDFPGDIEHANRVIVPALETGG
ncbi:MAG TPA: NTP transferase domain-containing protein [Candidatus Paceibacterota bacterium]|nr:NTP transferase domain-containing protein [Verrucomicrobiota bacterium]HRZ44700.1 NTP transferase domain-containing protein [Candidatus Paceibacterota bacterium]HRZ91686.1 NTP transferase domain-containing protein [Candidatus Paceibacterota bacterium]